MELETIKIRCPQCRSAVIESARERDGRLVTRYKALQRIGNQLAVQCRCSAWVKVPKEVI